MDLDNVVRNVTHATRSRWVGRNFGHILYRFWTKVYQIKYACAGEIAAHARGRLQCRFPFDDILCFFPDLFAIKSRVHDLMFLGRRCVATGVYWVYIPSKNQSK